MYKVPFFQSNFKINRLDTSIIEDIIQSGIFVNGEYTQKLEDYFRNKCDVRHAIACANATSGLTIALRCMGANNKTIAVPAFTWWSTAYAIKCAGGNPIYCDIDPKTWHVKFDKNTKADILLPVDTFGSQISVKSRIPTLYDAAHGFGMPGLGKRGTVEVLSLAATKVVTAMQGGMILTNDDRLGLVIRDSVKSYAKITEMGAYIALRSIGCYSDNATIRHSVVKNFKARIDVPVEYQAIPKFTNNSVFSLLFETPEIRNRIIDDLEASGIETKAYYTPIKLGLKNTDEVYSRILSLPTYYSITGLTHKLICDIVNGIC